MRPATIKPRQSVDDPRVERSFPVERTTPEREPRSTVPPLSTGKVYAPERWLLRRALKSLGDPRIRVVLWNGEVISVAGAQPVASVIIRDRSTLLRLIANPDLAFGDAYCAGTIEIDGDLVAFLEALYRARMTVKGPGLLTRLLNRPRSTGLSAARDNIHHHYDIGNDFYKLWLDDQLVYTCAYFPTPATTLEQAQIAKMDKVCRKIRLRPGESVVEAGCGWGSLALHMARHHGVTVKAFNISHEQIAYARQQAKALGCERRVEFIEDDYRNIRGTYDAFVSVGMLEHVGTKYYGELGAVMHRCLNENGRGLIHSIGRNRPDPLNAWIARRIFPGAYPPSLREMIAILEPWQFSVLDVENLRLHYAKTVQHWLERFESAADHVAGMFDREFVRAWRLYLAGSIAAFLAGSLQLFQIVFARSTCNRIPWTRAFLYADDPVSGT
jgi:cyclopropane-fatty-acyl-phospholipid synthase